MDIRNIVMHAALAGFAASLSALAVMCFCSRLARPLEALLSKFRSLPWCARAFLALFAAVFIVHGSTKTNAPPACSPRMLLSPRNLPATGFSTDEIAAGAAFVGVSTNGTRDSFAPGEGAHVLERWRLRGAAEEIVPLGCSLPDGTPLMMDTFGGVVAGGRAFSLVPRQLGMVPEANWEKLGAPSLGWWSRSASNSTVVTWSNALLSRDASRPVCLQAEFFEDGSFVYRYDLSSLGDEASDMCARVVSGRGAVAAGLLPGVTSVRGHFLEDADAVDPDRDRDGVTTRDEMFVYGTDPALPDTDGDGVSDGAEIAAGDDPLSGDVSEEEIVASIGAGVTNAATAVVSGELGATKLWDGFVFRSDAGTNALYSRTFEIDRRNGWTSFFLSSRGGEGDLGGAGQDGGWSLIGAVLEWEDDAGRSGVLSSSPAGDSVRLPVSPDATSLTVTLRALPGAGRHASVAPVSLLEYTPPLVFPGCCEVVGGDGSAYLVCTNSPAIACALDLSNRPCRAPAGDEEPTADDFRVPTEPGVYVLPSGEPAPPDVLPLLASPAATAAPSSSGGSMQVAAGRYLVIIDPWVRYGVPHYICRHDFPFDWRGLGWWCDCVPSVGSGVRGYSFVSSRIVREDEESCTGVVEVGGSEVWRGDAEHHLWPCDHYAPVPYCPCGCDRDCEYCSCLRPDGASCGSVRFRASLGEDETGRTLGFAWFESEGPVEVTPSLFAVGKRPDADVAVTQTCSSVSISAAAPGGRELVLTAISNGVEIAVSRHGEGAAFETWTVSNEGGPSAVRFALRDASGALRGDWTYRCSGAEGGWTWEAEDNFDPGAERPTACAVTELGTNFVYGADGLLERLTVGSNAEERVIRTFSYDADGRLVLVDDGTNGCVSIAYDEAGNVSEMTGPEGTLRASWDADGAMTGLDTSAWRGPVPDRHPLLRAPTRLGAGTPPGSGPITPLDALMNFLYGEGAPMTMPFSEIDTGWLEPIDFPAVRRFVSECHVPGDYPICATKSIATRGSQQYFLGHVTLSLEGTVSCHGHCEWSFEGTMSALDDQYDFEAASRGEAGETLAKIGRLLFEAHGTPFTIGFSGTKPLAGSGHCGDGER